MSKQRRALYCWMCDVRKAWHHIRHAKAARWTVGVHIVYYAHAAWDAHGMHFWTALACGIVLLIEFLSREK